MIRVRCVFAGLSRVKQRCPGTPPLLKGSWDVVGLSIYFADLGVKFKPWFCWSPDRVLLVKKLF